MLNYHKEHIKKKGRILPKTKRDSNSNIENAYRGIKRLMLDQSLVPGQRLLYRELTLQLNMSKTPIVNALNRLEQEGFVISEPNVGYTVKPINAKEIMDAYDVREALETKALTRAIEKATRKDLSGLSRKLATFEQYRPDSYDKKKLMTDCEFHLHIAAISGNDVLTYLLKRNFEHTILRTTMEHYPAERMDEAALEHQALYKAIENQDEKSGTEMITRHIRTACDNVIACLSHKNSTDLGIESSFDFG